MHISISREDLLKPLGHVAGIIERRQTLPILSNLLIKAEQDNLSLTGTDLEVEVVATLATPCEKTGDVTVPARKLLDICRALPTDARLDIQLSGEKVTVKSGKSRFSLLSLPARDFPSIETSDWDLRISLPQNVLKGLFERTQFSMAQQDVRYYLNGLLLELDGKQLRAVATDGHRMAISSITHDSEASSNKQVIVPKKGVHELTRFLDDSDVTVEIAISSNHLRATLPNMVFTTKLIDGRFPDYNKVIPESQNKHIMLNRDQFRDALNRAAILSNEKYRGIRFTIAPGTLTITAHNPDQEEAQEEMSIDYSGEEMEVGFNSNYVIEAAAALETTEVELGLQDANSSGTLRAPGDERTQYVIMPMRL